MAEIIVPDYLNESADIIHGRMLEKAPEGITVIEGDIFWDTTRPTAEEKSRLEKIQLQNIIKQSHPQTATGVYLEYFGEFKGIYKNQATQSKGYIQVTAKPTTPIFKDTIFGTISTEEKESIQFNTLEDIVIGDSGVALIEAECMTAGTIGNVEPNTITILFSKSVSGIKNITNPERFAGGTEIEDEEHFRTRVMAAEQEENLSGADSDYEKWALEVDGVGYAYALEEWNGPSTVKVFILDKNGQPATQELIKAAKNYIYPDKIPGQNRGGKAPVGAVVTIDTPPTLSVNIKAKFYFTSGFDSNVVLSDLKDEISSYLKQLKINSLIKYNEIHTIVGSYILQSKGISDFENLTVNNVVTNINLSNQVPVIGEVANIA
ncbi:baseplate J/gp47 family protein [Clostridium beijerinckii]|uniref:baseplate J/gp47 family protein n=1 Tax=Clostridium beijerinckii TaxID=1520 RepID=UPI002FEDEC08